MKADEKQTSNKLSVSLFLDKGVLMMIDKKSNELDRSRSWMANMLFRQALGLLPEPTDNKGKK